MTLYRVEMTKTSHAVMYVEADSAEDANNVATWCCADKYTEEAPIITSTIESANKDL